MTLRFSLADPHDDAALRALLARNVMEGDIAVTFRREPSYFHAATVQGAQAEIYIGKDTENGVIAGVGGRFQLPACINGTVQEMGYLADLRVEHAYRGGIGLRRAYDFLRERHAQNPLPLYTTMILQGNHQALNTIASGRAGLPPYQPHGFVHTPMILLGLRKPALPFDGHIARAQEKDSQALFAFLQREHARRQFAPHYRENDLYNGRLRGLTIGDFWLAWREDEIIGAIARWDQHAFRQIHVESYQRHWRWLKPLYNTIARFSPLPVLPNVGQALRHAYLALPAVKNDDPAVFRALLRAVYRDSCGQSWHYLTCALHERDPLLPVLQEYRHIPAGGHLFTVQFDDTPYPLDNRVPHIEAAAL